ncbi:hemogen isoform 2-T2 [Leptosomus discolor]
MENSKKDLEAHSDSSLPSSAASEEYAVPEVIITHRRLRDRKMLQKRKAEAQEKEAFEWFPREQKKQQKKGREARRKQYRQSAMKPSQKPEPELGHQPDTEEEAEPESSELASPKPVYQEELPMQSIEGEVSVRQPGAEEGDPAAGSQDPAGEEVVLKPAEAEIPEVLNIPFEN